MKILTVANQKGGVGKSTFVTQLAYYLFLLGSRVIVLDHDPQAHSTKPIKKSGKAYITTFNTAEILRGDLKYLDGRIFVAGTSVNHDFALVPAHSDLTKLESSKEFHNLFIGNLKHFIEQVKNQFDLCIIDTNPNPDIRYIASLAVSTHAIAPMQLNQEALDGVNNMLNHPNYGINNIKQKLNPKLKFVGILPSLVQGNPFQKENFIEVKSKLKKLLIPAQSDFIDYAHIPFSIAFAEAQQAGLMLREIKKSSAQKAWRVTKHSFDAVAKSIRLEI